MVQIILQSNSPMFKVTNQNYNPFRINLDKYLTTILLGLRNVSFVAESKLML